MLKKIDFTKDAEAFKEEILCRGGINNLTKENLLEPTIILAK